MMVKVLASSLALEQPSALRDAALRAAHACRKIIFVYNFMPAKRLQEFSDALHSTLTESESPRQHLLCLQILYSCAKSEAWGAHMLKKYHSNCLDLANNFPYPGVDPLLSDHLALYIIANLQAMQELSDLPLDLPDASSCQKLVPKAWHSLVARQIGHLTETVEHLSTFTGHRLNEGMILGTDDWISCIGQALGQLRLAGSDFQAVNDLLLYITTPRDSSS